mmetsp:Transcript_37114/g.83144  ORF Transcript_37114/g.83144 Transcript_37114/m.83144 type:complete len:408 (-) Transcript_37114:524-1747(-)
MRPTISWAHSSRTSSSMASHRSSEASSSAASRAFSCRRASNSALEEKAEVSRREELLDVAVAEEPEVEQVPTDAIDSIEPKRARLPACLLPPWPPSGAKLDPVACAARRLAAPLAAAAARACAVLTRRPLLSNLLAAANRWTARLQPPARLNPCALATLILVQGAAWLSTWHVSAKSAAAGFAFTIMHVRPAPCAPAAVPERCGASRRVSLDSRKRPAASWAFILDLPPVDEFSRRLARQVMSVKSEVLIALASLSACPVAPVFFSRSEPARSTKFRADTRTAAFGSISQSGPVSSTTIPSAPRPASGLSALAPVSWLEVKPRLTVMRKSTCDRDECSFMFVAPYERWDSPNCMRLMTCSADVATACTAFLTHGPVLGSSTILRRPIGSFSTSGENKSFNSSLYTSM